MQVLTILLLFTCGSHLISGDSGAPLPIVLWHGMGDSCCFPFSLGAFKNYLEKQLPGIYVKSLKIGGSFLRDYESGFFIHPDVQIEDVCNQLRGDPKLGGGFNAIGFSQGGQFLRALVQRCSPLNVRTLVSMGGQHQGIFGLPNCSPLRVQTCEYFRRLLDHGAYTKFMQKRLVQATYWHDPFNETAYKMGSTFLTDINNEITTNDQYISNLQRLNKLVFVKFLNDTIVVPKESQWFEFYYPGQDKDITPLKDSEIYQSDRLGLQTMNNEGKLLFLSVEGNHLQFTNEWFDENILPLLR